MRFTRTQLGKRGHSGWIIVKKGVILFYERNKKMGKRDIDKTSVVRGNCNITLSNKLQKQFFSLSLCSHIFKF